VLSDYGAVKYRESGTPAGEVTNEYFRIGRRKLRICTEDGMFVSLWGEKALVNEVFDAVSKHLQRP
jgi:hypothetical protein